MKEIESKTCIMSYVEIFIAFAPNFKDRLQHKQLEKKLPLLARLYFLFLVIFTRSLCSRLPLHIETSVLILSFKCKYVMLQLIELCFI